MWAGATARLKNRQLVQDHSPVGGQQKRVGENAEVPGLRQVVRQPAVGHAVRGKPERVLFNFNPLVGVLNSAAPANQADFVEGPPVEGHRWPVAVAGHQVRHVEDVEMPDLPLRGRRQQGVGRGAGHGGEVGVQLFEGVGLHR